MEKMAHLRLRYATARAQGLRGRTDSHRAAMKSMCFIFFRAQTDDVKMDQYILYFSLIEIYLDMLNT